MVTSITGRADSFDLVFKKNQLGQWDATVPADLSDGTYVVEIWARDECGNIAYYTALLYMYEGCVFKLEIFDEFEALIYDAFSAKLEADAFEALMQDSRFSVRFSERVVKESEC
ncbi:MAG: PF13754 domain-containing protein [Bacillota bacterium]|nr:PF13754 domain-containing protein [Bacillota bacterium]